MESGNWYNETNESSRCRVLWYGFSPSWLRMGKVARIESLRMPSGRTAYLFSCKKAAWNNWITEAGEQPVRSKLDLLSKQSHKAAPICTTFWLVICCTKGFFFGVFATTVASSFCTRRSVTWITISSELAGHTLDSCSVSLSSFPSCKKRLPGVGGQDLSGGDELSSLNFTL